MPKKMSKFYLLCTLKSFVEAASKRRKWAQKLSKQEQNKAIGRFRTHLTAKNIKRVDLGDSAEIGNGMRVDQRPIFLLKFRSAQEFAVLLQNGKRLVSSAMVGEYRPKYCFMCPCGLCSAPET